MGAVLHCVSFSVTISFFFLIIKLKLWNFSMLAYNLIETIVRIRSFMCCHKCEVIN